MKWGRNPFDQDEGSLLILSKPDVVMGYYILFFRNCKKEPIIFYKDAAKDSDGLSDGWRLE